MLAKILAVGFLVCSAAEVASAEERKLRAEEVPAGVSAAAKRRFASAHFSNWSTETEAGKTTYEVSVSDQNGKLDAVFSKDGSLLALEQRLELADLPPTVKSAILGRYPGAVMLKAEKITHDGISDFEVDLAKPARKEITVDANGKILKEE